MTHTYVLAKVTPETYNEIKELLNRAGYQHAIHTRHHEPDECLDMRGIALVMEEGKARTGVMVPTDSGTCEGGLHGPCVKLARWRIRGGGFCDAHAKMHLFQLAKNNEI